MRYLPLIGILALCPGIAAVAWAIGAREAARVYGVLTMLVAAWWSYAVAMHITHGWWSTPSWWPAVLPVLGAPIFVLAIALTAALNASTPPGAVLVFLSACAVFVADIHTDVVSVSI